MKWHPKKESSIFWTHNHRGIVIIFKKIQVHTICRSKIVVQTDQPLDWSMRNHIGRRTTKGLRSVSGNFPSYPRNTNSLNRWPNNSRVRFERRNLKPNTSFNREKKRKGKKRWIRLDSSHNYDCIDSTGGNGVSKKKKKERDEARYAPSIKYACVCVESKSHRWETVWTLLAGQRRTNMLSDRNTSFDFFDGFNEEY